MDKFLILVLVFFKMTCNTSDESPITLLEDDALSMFEIKGGTAEYSLDNQILAGTAVWDSPNTFMTTKEKYSDFILDFSVKVDPRLNSGVQIRSEVFTDENGQETLRGYQVEIDPSTRAWSGGIYEERGRGWIGNLSNNQQGREAFKRDEWNAYHIEAIGNSIRVWVNGINTVNLLDNQASEGVIGFQVHSIYNEDHIGAKVQWKDIQLRTKKLDGFINPTDKLAKEINLVPNELSTQEKKVGWKIFDRDNVPMQDPGMELTPWYLGKDQFCSGQNTMQLLRLQSVTGNFELKFEYQIQEGGMAQLNYGYVDDPYSYMLTDDANIPKDTYGHLKAGSIANFVEAANLSNPDREKAMRSLDQWSQAHIIVEGDNVKHWLNNNLVVDVTVSGFQNENKQRLLEFKSQTSKLCLRSIKLLSK